MHYSSERLRKRWDKIKFYVIMVLVTVIVLFPFYWMLITSVRPAEEILMSPPRWWPTSFNFQNYIVVWKTIPLFTYLKNSIILSVLSTILCVVLTVPAAYALTRFRFRARKFYLGLVLATQLLPTPMMLIPLYFMFYNAGLNNTLTGMILVYCVWSVPFCILMLRSYFPSAIPTSVLESARVDGCTEMGVLVRIVLPMSVPGIVSTSVFSFILAWNEFMWTSIIITEKAMKTISLGIYDFIGKSAVTPMLSQFMTTAVIALIPSLILFAFLQKYLVSGLTAGAVKG